MASSACSGTGRLDGKVALITGASSGIGRSTAIKFAQLGARLALVGRKVSQLEEAGKECEAVQPHSKVSQLEEAGKECEAVQPHSKPLLIKADLSKEADTERVVKDTIDQFHQLDILVNCAGIYTMGSIETTSLDQFDETFTINVRAVYHLTMLCAPHLVHSQGNVVNVSSINAIRVFPGDLAYSMSKGALDQFTRCVALELGPKQVRVNSVNPGVIVTDVHRRAGMDEETYQKFLERSRVTHALGRPGRAEEVSDAIAFLASPSAAFITGVTLPVDGGRQAMCP